MSEETKEAVETPEEANEQEFQETQENPEEVPEISSKDDEVIFVEEEDTFDIKVNCYKKDNKLYVEDIDDEFDAEYEDIKVITMTLKYPSQADCDLISIHTRGIFDSSGEVSIREINRVEVIRMLTLARSWNSKRKMDNDNLLKLNPKIVKGICLKIQDEIQMSGIV